LSTPDATTELPNAVLIRRLYDAFARRDRELVCSLIAEDCRWIIPGRGAQAGVYEGRDTVIELLRGITKDTAGSAEFDLDAIIADDRYAVVLQRGRGTIRGTPAELDECLVYRIEDGRIVEMKEFQFDLYALDEWLDDAGDE
jgi:ketosteroid isomerase-like protein